MKRRDFISRSVALMAASCLATSRFARAAQSVDVPAVSRTGSAITLKAVDIADFRTRSAEPCSPRQRGRTRFPTRLERRV